MRRAALAVALLCAADAAAQSPQPQVAGREPAWKRHRELVEQVRYRIDDVRIPEAERRALIARLAPVARELGDDMTDPAIPWNEKRVVIEELERLKVAARPAIPAMIAALDPYPDDHGPPGVGHFCSVTEALAQIAPEDPRVIAGVSAWLDANANGLCHRCGCALDLLKTAGPAAAGIAGPVLTRLTRRQGLMTTYPSQLADTVAALGVAAPLAAILLDRVRNDGLATNDRIASMRALAKEAGRLDERTRAEFLQLATDLLRHDDAAFREAAAETLGALGPPALVALRHALQDRHAKVRAAAALALAALGPAAAPAAAELAEAVDPFRGTAASAITALVAIGGPARAALLTRAETAPGWLRPLLIATAAAALSGNARGGSEALRRGFDAGPGGVGFVRVEVKRAGTGPVYDASAHRMKLHARGGAIGPGSAGLPQFDHQVDASSAPNSVFYALAGRREGDVVRVTLSPETAQSVLAGTEDWIRNERFQRAVPEGVAAAYEVEIQRVCQPVVWRPFPHGIFLDLKFEVFCRTPR